MKIIFQISANGKKASKGYQFVNCHMVFVKTDDFQRKACFVAGGHVTQIPEVITYSSVVTMETVCVTLTMVALHDIEVI